MMGFVSNLKGTSLSRRPLFNPIFRSSGSGQTTTFAVPESLRHRELTPAFPVFFRYHTRRKSILTSISPVARS